MKKSTKKTKQKFLRKLMRVHFVLTFFSLGVYALIAFLDPGFLSYDLRQKYHTLAAEILTVSATVLDVPTNPFVTGVSECDNNTGTLRNTFDWSDDINTYTYDISRDGLPLISGLSVSEYIDTSITVGTTYLYVVTAHGPMGPGLAVSNSLSLATPSTCGNISLLPSVQMTAFDGRSMDFYSGIPSTSSERPLFNGTTNIPNAIVQIVVGPSSSFFAQFNTNINGYFSWQPPVNFPSGEQTFTVTIFDPNDNSRFANTSFVFEIKSRNTHASNTKKNASQKTLPQIPVAIPDKRISHSTISDAVLVFSLFIKNHEKKVFQGETLDVSVLMENVPVQYRNTNIPLRFSILDTQGTILSSFTGDESFDQGTIIQKKMETPLYIQSGMYSVQVEVLLEGMNMSHIISFSVVDLPLISLGGGAFITYAEIVHNTGWIVLTLLILLLLWFFLFMREYGMYLQSLRHVTERHLMNAGLMTRRKGVMQ